MLAPPALLATAAAPLAEIVRDLRPEHLALPTPCAEYDVRDLAHHLLFWGPSLDASARKEATPPPTAAETDLDLVVGDWRAALETQIAAHVTAWGDPAAWQGTAPMGGPDRLPAAMIGGMVVGELVVHGWDLGRALDRRPEWDEDVLAFLLSEVAATAEMGRQLGVYGPEVAVPGSARLLDRVLGTTGRDPGWTP